MESLPASYLKTFAYAVTISTHYTPLTVFRQLRKVEVPVGFEPTTILQSRDALSGAGYKPDALPLSYETIKIFP